MSFEVIMMKITWRAEADQNGPFCHILFFSTPIYSPTIRNIKTVFGYESRKMKQNVSPKPNYFHTFLGPPLYDMPTLFDLGNHLQHVLQRMDYAGFDRYAEYE